MPDGPLEGLEASRRVGWAMYYEQVDLNERQAVVVNSLRRQNEALLDELDELSWSVLTKRNIIAFAHAFRIRTLVDKFRQAS
jgi:hypothetical protein